MPRPSLPARDDCGRHCRARGRAEALLNFEPPRLPEARASLEEAAARGMCAPSTHCNASIVTKFRDLNARLDAMGGAELAPPTPPRPAGGRPPVDLREVIGLLATQLTPGNNTGAMAAFTPQRVADMLLEMVEERCLVPPHPAAVDPLGEGTLLWAVCITLADRQGEQLPCLALVRALAALGVPVDQRTECGRVALQFLARACNPEAVGELLKLGADVQLRDEIGWTPLMSACMVPAPSLSRPPLGARRLGEVSLPHDGSEV